MLFFLVKIDGAAEVLMRAIPESFSASIVIPCHHLHAKYLVRVCEAYAQQTVLPEEIVIAVSGVDYLNKAELKEIENKNWPFSVTLVLSDQSKTESQNKNLGAKTAKCDIIICQDADDLPHPQRVEIVKYYFNNYDIVHLMHSMTGVDDEFVFFPDVSKIGYQHCSSLYEVSYLDLPFGNGPVAILRSLINTLQWDERMLPGQIGSDMRFNELVYQKYSNTLLVPARIYRYFWAQDSIYINHGGQ